MRTYRALFWIEVEAEDRKGAEIKAIRKLKSKKVDAKIYSIEEG